MKALHRAAVKAAAALCVLGAGTSFAIHADDPPEANSARVSDDAPREIDLKKASIAVDLPTASRGDGTSFMIGHSTEEAWVARVASGNPRSPAAEDGMVVVGSGGGSLVFGYETATGKQRWTASSKDAGISNIVISLGYAYYTTHSCTLERVRVVDGKGGYSKYLAPTVNCAPDVKDEVVATAYRSGSSYKVSLHDAEKGARKWLADVGSTNVLTAPVMTDGGVFVACADGGVACLDGKKGIKRWKAEFGAVSAPVATKWGLLVTTTWDGQSSGGARPADKPMTAEEQKKADRETVTSTSSAVARTVVAAKDRRVAIMDDPGEKPEGKNAQKLAGPSGGLDFQGLRPGVSNTRIYFAYAGNLVAVDPMLGRMVWSVKLADSATEYTRPVIQHGLVFVAGSDGIVSAFEERAGALVWSYRFKGAKFMSEPCVDGDNLLLTTAAGQLICMPIGIGEIAFGNPDADGDDVEGVASIYWKVQQAFRNVRNIVREVESVPEPAPLPGPDADNNTPQNSGPTGEGRPGEALPPREDEEEELTKGQWERREERKSERAKSEGKNYEKKPFKRR